VYGSVKWPSEFGACGGDSIIDSFPNGGVAGRGGQGGGVISVRADSIFMTAASSIELLAANGMTGTVFSGSNVGGGGGTGGSILVQANQLIGNGMASAIGAGSSSSSYRSGAGSGGRISFQIADEMSSNVHGNAAGG